MLGARIHRTTSSANRSYLLVFHKLGCDYEGSASANNTREIEIVILQPSRMELGNTKVCMAAWNYFAIVSLVCHRSVTRTTAMTYAYFLVLLWISTDLVEELLIKYQWNFLKKSSFDWASITIAMVISQNVSWCCNLQVFAKIYRCKYAFLKISTDCAAEL